MSTITIFNIPTLGDVPHPIAVEMTGLELPLTEFPHCVGVGFSVGSDHDRYCVSSSAILYRATMAERPTVVRWFTERIKQRGEFIVIFPADFCQYNP